MLIEIRPFEPRDAAELLAIFESNVPQFFGKNEAEEFTRFLSQPNSDFFVAAIEGTVSGCGGCYTCGSEGWLCWGMVHVELQGRGIGKVLLKERLGRLFADPKVALVASNTSQHTQWFFERFGFSVAGDVMKSGFAPGIDKVRMQLSREEWQQRGSKL